MMDKKSANGLSSKAGEGGGQRRQLPYSVETPYGFHLDLDFLKYVDDIEKGNTIKRVHIHRRARGPKFSTLPRNFSLPGHGARPPPRDTWSGTSTLGPKPKSRLTEVQQIFDFRPSDGGMSSQSRVQVGSYASTRPKEEAGAGARVFDEGLQGRPNLLRTSSMPVTVQHRKGSDSADDRPGNTENGSSENVFRAADVIDRRCLPQDRTGLHQQITVALKRVRELEEQVRTIPELKAQICSLREEREQLLLRLQAQARAAGPSPAQSTDPGTDAELPGGVATGEPGSTSAGGVSEKQRSAEDQAGVAGRETLQEPVNTSVAHTDAGLVVAQASERQAQPTEGSEGQTEAIGSLSENMPEKLSGDGATLKAPDTSECLVLAGNTDSISKMGEDLGSVQQLRDKLIALEAKLTQAGRDLDNTNTLLREQVEENQRKEERIQQLSEGAREELPTEEETAGRRESVDRDTETETVDIADRETETERAGTADQGTDTETIEVLVGVPRERANSVDRGTETERLDMQDQLTETEMEMVAEYAGRGRANSVDQETETERVDTVDQVTETQPADRVDQVTETETNTPGVFPVRPRADSVDQETETERVDTVDQVTETEGMRSADQQTETVRERHDRQNSNPGDTVEFRSMVTGTFLTESVVIESMDTERAASVFEDSMAVESVVRDVELVESSTPEESVVRDVELAESSTLEESVVTDVELKESSTPPEESVVTDVELKESSAPEESVVTGVELKESSAPEQSVVTGVELKESSAPEQSVATEIEVRESMFTEQVVTEQVPPESVVAEYVVTENVITEIVVTENVVLETVQSTVVESEAAREAVPESVVTDDSAKKAAAPESPIAVTGPTEPEQKEPEQPQAQSQPQPQLQPQAQSQPQPQLQAQSQPQTQLQAQSQTHPQLQPQAQSQPQTQLQPQAQSQPQTQLQPQAQPQPQAPPQRPHRPSSEAQTQPPCRASGESPTPTPPRGSGEASTSQPPRRGSGDNPTSPAALGQVVTRLTGLLNEQWAQLGSGGQQGGGQQHQDTPGVQKPASKAAAKPAGKAAGKAGPSKMSSIQSQLVSSLSALSAFYSPGQKATASKQQGLKSIMKKNEGADKGNGGAKKNLKFVGVNGGYETTSSEESSGEDNAPEEEVDSSEPEDQQQEQEEKEEAQEKIQDGAPQGEDSGPGAQGGGAQAGAQGGGAQAGETEGRAGPQDPESSQGLQEEQVAGETVDKDFMEACHYIKDHMGEVTAPDKDMRQVLLVLYQEWFRVSSQKDSLSDTVTRYLRAVGVATPTLLRYIVNLADGNGNTALHYSVSHSNFPVVKLLLDTGLCEVNTQNKAGYTAVMLASLTAADGSEDMEVALQLLRQGDVNARASQAGQTALMLAVSHGRTAMVRLLLICQADVNIQDRDGSTALMCACEHGHAQIARLLLDSAHCDASLADKDGQTALSVAVQASHSEIVDLLKANSDASASDPPTTTAAQ